MSTSNPQFIDELNCWIGSFVETKLYNDGRWSAWLTPEHSFIRLGAFPPGQVNIVGDDAWIVENEYAPLRRDGRLGEVFALEGYKAAWAARPFFYSHDAAQAHVERWIRENRPDIVRECASQAAQALTYRDRKAEKAARA